MVPPFKIAGSWFIEGSLEAKLRQYGEMEMAQPGRNSDVEKGRREKIRDGESQQAREKVGKSRNTVFFQCFVAAEGRNVGALKRRVRR